MAGKSASTEKVVKELGQGIKTTVEGNKLTIEIDLGKTFGLSESKKTTIIASSRGAQEIGYGDAKLNLNLYKSNPNK